MNRKQYEQATNIQKSLDSPNCLELGGPHEHRPLRDTVEEWAFNDCDRTRGDLTGNGGRISLRNVVVRKP